MDASAIAHVVGEENVTRVASELSSIVEASFVVAPVRRLTRSAIQERIDICLRLLRLLRGDLKWSLTKALDHVAEYLVYELNGVAYTPNPSSTWSPGPRRTPGGLILP